MVLHTPSDTKFIWCADKKLNFETAPADKDTVMSGYRAGPAPLRKLHVYNYRTWSETFYDVGVKGHSSSTQMSMLPSQRLRLMNIMQFHI